jgi:hypothetical protein
LNGPNSMAPEGEAPQVSDRACRKCSALPNARVGRSERHRLPRSWRPVEEHPELRPGPWVPRGEMKGVVFCESCGCLWLLFLDPAQDYYTDVVELAPELVALVSEDAELAHVMALAVSADTLLQLMIRDWFALADYDRSEAAEALVREIARPEISTRLAVRLLDFLAAVLAGSGRRHGVRVADASPLVELLDRVDLVSLDPVRRQSERKEMSRLLAGIARAGFGAAFGGDRDRLATSPEARDALLAFAASRDAHRDAHRGATVLAPPGRAPIVRRLRGVEHLVSEIEDLLRVGANRVTSQEIAPIVEVVRSFWDADGAAHRWDPGLALYRRCRDLLLALRHARLIPEESAHEVEEVLTLS